MRRKQRNAKVGVLQGLPGLGTCSSADLAALAAMVDEHSVQAGEVLSREGRVVHDLYVVVDGCAEARREGILLWEVTAGGMVGELGLDRAPAAVTMVARTPMRLLAVSPRARSELLRLPGVAAWMYRELAARLRMLVGAPMAWGSTTRAAAVLQEHVSLEQVEAASTP